MSTVDLFEWTFSPANYFEDYVVITGDHYKISITDGKISANINSAIYESDSLIYDRIERLIGDRFYSAQLLFHKPYKLSKSSRTRVYEDGHRDRYLMSQIGCISVTGSVVNFIFTDHDGNIITDSKRDHIQQIQDLSALISRCRNKDLLVDVMLNSYDAAVNDPQNELVHLYEIRDSLSTRFGNESEACKATGITASEWSRMGRLCNCEPLRQGRHRGKTASGLRDATEAELSEARTIARSMLKKYLQFIDTSVA